MAISRSKSKEMYFTKYKTSKTFEVNKKRKLLKLLKLQPNNLQIPAALACIRSPRGAPKVPKWSHTAIRDTMLAASFKKAKQGQVILPMPTQPFSLGVRARGLV